MSGYIPLFHTDSFTDNFFIILLFFTAVILIMAKFFYPKRFGLNISHPNIYVFEYESQAHRSFSLYNILISIIRFSAYLLLLLSFMFFYEQTYDYKIDVLAILEEILMAYLYYVFIKLLLELLLLKLVKKHKKNKKIGTIRRTYETYLAFYFILLSFFIYYYPYKNSFSFYLIVWFSISLFILAILNLHNSLSKHIEMNTYQLFLYLCLTEILPLISLIWWISFQIL